MVPLEFLVPQTSEFEVESHVFHLRQSTPTFGSSLSISLSTSEKLDSVTSIYEDYKVYGVI